MSESKFDRTGLGGGTKSSAEAKSAGAKKSGYFVRGGVQTSNVDNKVHYEEVSKTHFATNEEEEGPDAKKSKLDMVHEDDYQRKLFSAAQNYMGQKNKKDLIDNIRRFNWKVQTGQKSASIKANDIKGYLYIWCNQRHVTPEFDYKEDGNRHKKTFICTLTIGGLDFLCESDAKSKKDAQTAATWKFCEKLADLGYMDRNDFPRKEQVATNAAGCIPSDWHQILTAAHIDEAGGWTPDSCQKRLQTFCNTEKVSCEIINSSMGPDHAKIQIAELKITLKKYGKEFYAKEQARTKKCANNLVCWSIVKQLFIAKMVEQCGTKVRRPNEIKKGETTRMRAGIETIDEITGDWTLETARQKLHEFLAKRKIALEYIMEEIGAASSRTYIAKLDFELDGKQYTGKESAPNKKSAQKKCALDVCCRLYRDGKIGANTMQPGQYVDPRRPFINGVDPPQKQKNEKPIDKMNHRERDEYACKVKLETITPDANFVNAVTLFMDHIEKSLKEISDEFLKTEMEKEEISNSLKTGKVKSVEELRDICGVMKVGALSAQMNLKGEKEFLAVLMTKEKPTFTLLERISKAVEKNFATNYHENYKVMAAKELGGIELFRLAEPQVTVLLSLASTKCRPTVKDESGIVKEEPATPESDDFISNEKCLRALADLRRAKWYHVCAMKLQNCLEVSRLLRDMSLRVPTWNVLSDWNIQLIVQKALESAERPLPVSDGVRRAFSLLSAGVISKGGTGIVDPCEREPIDCMWEMSVQEREDVTASAQHALRLAAFGNLFKILGIPPLETIATEEAPTGSETV